MIPAQQTESVVCIELLPHVFIVCPLSWDDQPVLMHPQQSSGHRGDHFFEIVGFSSYNVRCILVDIPFTEGAESPP